MKVLRSNHPTLDRLFDDFFLPDWQRAPIMGVAPTASAPRVNIVETNDGYFLEMAAPGWSKADFNIELNEDVLTINATVDTQETDSEVRYTKKEFGKASFRRAFRMSELVDGEKITASYEHGILKVNLPKKEEAKPKAPKSIKIG